MDGHLSSIRDLAGLTVPLGFTCLNFWVT